MNTIKLAYGQENQTTISDMFGTSVQVGLRDDGSVLIAVRANGFNEDNENNELKQDVVVAFTPEQTRDIAHELLRLQP